MKAPAGAFNLLQDVGGLGGPDETFWLFIMAVDVLVDGGDEFLDATENSAAQSVLSQIAEEALHHV